MLHHGTKLLERQVGLQPGRNDDPWPKQPNRHGGRHKLRLPHRHRTSQADPLRRDACSAPNPGSPGRVKRPRPPDQCRAANDRAPRFNEDPQKPQSREHRSDGSPRRRGPETVRLAVGPAHREIPIQRWRLRFDSRLEAGRGDWSRADCFCLVNAANEPARPFVGNLSRAVSVRFRFGEDPRTRGCFDNCEASETRVTKKRKRERGRQAGENRDHQEGMAHRMRPTSVMAQSQSHRERHQRGQGNI